MIRDARTTAYEEPPVPLAARELELHVHYASNALAAGHEANCSTVTAARNWPQMTGRPECSCRKRFWDEGVIA